MFDISASELLVVGAVALIVIGPKELPGLLRTLGNMTSRVRRMAGDFRQQFDEAMREAEIDEAKKAFKDMNDTAQSVRPVFNPLDTIRNEIQSVKNEVRGTGALAAGATAVAAATTPAAGEGAAATPDPSPDPLAGLVPPPNPPPPVHITPDVYPTATAPSGPPVAEPVEPPAPARKANRANGAAADHAS